MKREIDEKIPVRLLPPPSHSELRIEAGSDLFRHFLHLSARGHPQLPFLTFTLIFVLLCLPYCIPYLSFPPSFLYYYYTVLYPASELDQFNFPCCSFPRRLCYHWCSRQVQRPPATTGRLSRPPTIPRIHLVIPFPVSLRRFDANEPPATRFLKLCVAADLVRLVRRQFSQSARRATAFHSFLPSPNDTRSHTISEPRPHAAHISLCSIRTRRPLSIRQRAV